MLDDKEITGEADETLIDGDADAEIATRPLSHEEGGSGVMLKKNGATSIVVKTRNPQGLRNYNVALRHAEAGVTIVVEEYIGADLVTKYWTVLQGIVHEQASRIARASTGHTEYGNGVILGPVDVHGIEESVRTALQQIGIELVDA